MAPPISSGLREPRFPSACGCPQGLCGGKGPA
jgi:hypothetical protein